MKKRLMNKMHAVCFINLNKCLDEFKTLNLQVNVRLIGNDAVIESSSESKPDPENNITPSIK